MSSRYTAIFCALLLCLSLFISACKKDEPNKSSDQVSHSVEANEMIVLLTDTDEWHVRKIAQHLLYSSAVKVETPSPWMLPTREDAQILKTLDYPHTERFVTSDGYTFGMPSASVSKAGQKTNYSVLGLWKRKTTYDIGF